MQQRKHLAAAALFLVLAVALGALWAFTRPQTAQGAKTITVEVIHKDGSSAHFTYETEEEYLGPVLTQAGLISGSDSGYGLFVDTVDGETAVYDQDGGWWRLSQNGEDTQTGVDGVVIRGGDAFSWTYTIS